ncbi:GntR family transcriptional regulator [Glaciimonas sp. GNP009]
MRANLVQQLEEEIVFGVLHSKEKLVEEELAERFNAKRHVIRDVLDDLESAGLITRIPNRGAFVRELTPTEVIEIYEVREILEVAAAMRTPLPAPQAILTNMEEIQARHSAAIAAGDLRSVFYLNIEFHQAQYSACNNTKLVESIIECAKQAHLIRAVKYAEPGHLKKVEKDHLAIIAAMSGTDREILVAVVKAHLPDSPNAYIRAYEIRYAGRTRSGT